MENDMKKGLEKHWKKAAAIGAIGISCVMVLAGCGSGTKTAVYKDGTYTATSSVYTNDDGSEDGNGYGTVTLTIKDGKIADCSYQTFEVDGTLKDEDYGKQNGEIANRDYYSKAQKAVAACDEYAKLLVANEGLDGLDAISGATVNYNEFKEAVQLALEEASAK